MVPIPGFSRKVPPDAEDLGIDIHASSAPTLPMSSLRTAAAHSLNKPNDPARKAVLCRIAIVSIEENANLPALLNEESLPTKIVQRIMLPRNPRIAGDELYELDGMDMIVVVPENEKHIGKDTLRWLGLLKQLGVPMLVLLPYVATKRREQQRVHQFSQYIGLPVIPVGTENLDAARQEFVVTTMQIAPAMGLALAAHLPHFRSPLLHNLLDTAVNESLSTENMSDITAIQQQLVHQLCAAYGHNGQRFEQQKVGLDMLTNASRHYTAHFVRYLPVRNQRRRTRLTNALSSLFIGYAAAIYLGAAPPSVRKELLPQIWRAYRASGKSVLD